MTSALCSRQTHVNQDFLTVKAQKAQKDENDKEEKPRRARSFTEFFCYKRLFQNRAPGCAGDLSAQSISRFGRSRILNK
jgi:hypothetical protein